VAGKSVIVGGVTVMEYGCVPVKVLVSVAVILKVKVPATVGVPEIRPAELSVRLVGRVPAVTA
jgi:hypothetical protein